MQKLSEGQKFLLAEDAENILRRKFPNAQVIAKWSSASIAGIRVTVKTHQETRSYEPYVDENGKTTIAQS